MKITLKPIAEQVVVVIGASSGIGRATATEFARKGAKVMVSARSEEGLTSLVDELKRDGHEASYKLADVSNAADVQDLADFTARQFGRIDTWVHVAGTSLYAEVEQTTEQEFREILDVNLIGTFNGIKAALPHLRKQGGALICISSVESQISLPLQGAYAASKHGVVGLIDTLRLELMHNEVPVSVTNIMPASIDTPFFEKARSKMGTEPKGISPVYKPQDVAAAVLYAAETPVRDLNVGGGGRIFSIAQQFAPGLTDRWLASTGYAAQTTGKPKEPMPGNAMTDQFPGGDRIMGTLDGRPSVYTWMRTHPKTTLAVGGLAAFALLYELTDPDLSRPVERARAWGRSFGEPDRTDGESHEGHHAPDEASAGSPVASAAGTAVKGAAMAKVATEVGRRVGNWTRCSTSTGHRSETIAERVARNLKSMLMS